MITPEKAVEAIFEKIQEIDFIQSYDQFYSWQKATIGTLKRLVPNNPTVIEHILEIKPIGNYGGDLKESAKSDSKYILKSLIKDIERFGLEEPQKEIEEKQVIKVDVQQHNHQNQSSTVIINIDLIIVSLKQGLSSVQLDEIKEILSSDLEPENKKKTFVDKVKSFGLDVASNILANLLTNPQVFEQLGDVLYTK
jgi:hypothetical protein